MKQVHFLSRNIGPSTINNPTAEDYGAVRTACANGLLDFVTFNHEVGENGTPHLQIMAKSGKPMRATAWQAALGGRVGNIVATKFPAHCLDYCQGFEPNTDRKTRKQGSQDASVPSLSTHLGYEEYGILATHGIRTSLGRIGQNERKRKREKIEKEGGEEESGGGGKEIRGGEGSGGGQENGVGAAGGLMRSSAFLHECSVCSKTFENERGLMIHKAR